MEFGSFAHRTCLFFILLILLGVCQGLPSVIDGKKWSKSTVSHDHDHDHDQNKNSKQMDMHPPVVDFKLKETNVLRLHSMDNNDIAQEQETDQTRRVEADHAHRHASDQMMNHMDLSTIVFFLLDDLKLGQKMPIYFPNRALTSSSAPPLLSKAEAEDIPFSSQQLPDLLQRFSFSPGSPQATAMEDTLRECERPPIKGETKSCSTSYKSMLNFARQILGSKTNIQLLSTIHRTISLAGLQEYTIVRVPDQVSAKKMIACHTMPYPYAIFYCHYQESESRVYRVSLHGQNGERVEAIAVCHMDTSQWSPNHISFRVLGIKPGTSPVCHFFPADNFVLVPSTTSI